MRCVVDQASLTRALTSAVAVGGPEAPLAVCRACVRWLPVTGAAIALMDGPGTQEPVCATDAGSRRIDELQFSLGDGPCVDAFASGRAVLVADITDPADTRWPVFAEAAAQTGARGMFVFPLHVGAARVGVLDLYRNTPGSLDDHELAGALRAADAAMWTLLDGGERRGHSGDERDDSPLLARAEIHQATGMLVAQAGISAQAGLARLRAAAFVQGRTLADVAEDVLARRSRLDADGTWRHHSHPDPEDASPRDTGDEERS